MSKELPTIYACFFSDGSFANAWLTGDGVPYIPADKLDQAAAIIEKKDREISALRQEVAGGSWAFVKQIEELQNELKDLALALEKALWCAENIQASSEDWQKKHHEASSVLVRYARGET